MNLQHAASAEGKRAVIELELLTAWNKFENQGAGENTALTELPYQIYQQAGEKQFVLSVGGGGGKGHHQGIFCPPPSPRSLWENFGERIFLPTMPDRGTITESTGESESLHWVLTPPDVEMDVPAVDWPVSTLTKLHVVDLFGPRFIRTVAARETRVVC